MNLFVSIKPNIQKFTLLIEKVTFQEKQYKIWIFSTKFGFNRSFLKGTQYAYGEKYLFCSHLKINVLAKAGYLPLVLSARRFHFNLQLSRYTCIWCPEIESRPKKAVSESVHLLFFTHACKTLVCALFTDSENGLFSHQCAK